MGQRFGALAGSVWKDPGGRSWELKGAPGNGRVIKLPTLSGAWNSIFKCRVKISGISFPQKNGALCLGIYDDPSRILRQNLSKMGGFDFFKKSFQRALRICFFWEGRRKAVGGGPFFCEMAQFCK